MKYIYHIFFTTICCLSCNNIENTNEIILDDRIYIENVTVDESFSRSNNIGKTTFINGDAVIFNSYGSHINKDCILSLNGNVWNSDKELKWDLNSKDSIHYSAIFPASYNYRYTINELYSDGALNDILLCKSVKPYKGKIDLKFNHIFSVLKIVVDDIPGNKISSVTISIPVSIDSLNIYNGDIHTISQESSNTENIGSDNSCYFIVPPVDNLIISLKLNGESQDIRKDISSFNYKPGKIYKCKINNSDKSKCIYNAEDLIAFTYLIKDKAYGQRSLDEFYYIKDGKRVFSLGKDISLTEKESDTLYLKHYEKIKFSDIFDGNGHTISNLNLKIDRTCKSLFGFIDESGVVRNLRIAKSSIFNINKYQGSLLAYRNYGLIDNCIIDSCSIESTEVKGSTGTCFVSLSSMGSIINTQVCNSAIKSSESSNNIFVKELKGKIINCSSANNEIEKTTLDANTGFIGKINIGCEIRNCYIKCFSNDKNNVYLISYELPSNATIENCFISDNIPAYYSGTKNPGLLIFNNAFKVKETESDVTTLLNRWIDDNSASYPQYQFKRWRSNTINIPAILIE